MAPWLQQLMPQHILTKLFGVMATLKIRWFVLWAIRTFQNLYNVNLNEALIKDITKYKDFNDFFTRGLEPNSRPIDTNSRAIVSPADGILSNLSKITHGELLQAKGHYYTTEELLSPQCCFEHLFQQEGYSFTIYLAPHNYHRVHMPYAGSLEQMIYVPGKLFSVNIKTTTKIPKLFARNERLICIFKTELGKMAIIMVGAMIVASIKTVWAGTINSKRSKTIQSWNYNNTRKILLNKGEELGQFKLGSTVIVLLENNNFEGDFKLLNHEVKFGSKIGEIL